VSSVPLKSSLSGGRPKGKPAGERVEAPEPLDVAVGEPLDPEAPGDPETAFGLDVEDAVLEAPRP